MLYGCPARAPSVRMSKPQLSLMRLLLPRPKWLGMALTARDGSEAAPTGPGRLLAEAVQVARHADARLTAALNDLFLPDFVRPTDSQRAAMANMLDRLV